MTRKFSVFATILALALLALVNVAVGEEGYIPPIREVGLEEEGEHRHGQSALTVSQSLGYTGQGVDDVVPDHFYRGNIVIQEFGISHQASGISVGLKNLTSPEGGGFSDLGDRTILTLSYRRALSKTVTGSIRHSYVHVNQPDEEWFHSDRHISSVRLDIQADNSVIPYVLVASNMPAYTPVDTSALYGGIGVVILVPLALSQSALRLDASGLTMIHQRGQDRITALRARADLPGVPVGPIHISPGINFLQDIDEPEERMTWVDVQVSF